MSLEFAILGYLNYKPFTGYDLKKIFDTSIRHFWYADQSQIYRTLARLTEDGLAEINVVQQSDRPDKKVYTITEKGRKVLHEWVAGPFPMQQPHSGPLIQIFFAGMLEDEAILAKFQQAAQIFRSMLEQYEQVPQIIDGYVDMASSPRESAFWMLTLKLGMMTMQAQLEWAEGVTRMLENHELPDLSNSQLPEWRKK